MCGRQCLVDQAQAPLGLDLQILDPLDGSEWDLHVGKHPARTVFHSAAWARVLVRTYGHTPQYVRFSQGGETVGLIPLMVVHSRFTGRRGVSLPFSDFCDPLIVDGGTASSHQMVCQLTRLAIQGKWKHLEIRGGAAPDSASPSDMFYAHTLDLTRGVENTERGFASSVRRAIRKAENSGLRIRISRSEASVLDFYRLHVRTRRRHGLPPQPVAFFKAIYEELIRLGLGFVAIAERERRGHAVVEHENIAAAVFFQLGDMAVYKFGASDERTWELRPNNLLMGRAIRFLIESGVKSLHFGRTTVDSSGLRQFKLKWGTEENLVHYFRFHPQAQAWIGGQPSHSRASIHNAIFSRLPLRLNRLAGSMIYRHLD